MTKSSVSSLRLSPVAGVTAALLMMAIFATQRAEAMSPVNPGMSEVGKTVAGKKAVANGLTIEVRGGHGGGGGGGGRSGGSGDGRGAGGVSGTVIHGGDPGARDRVELVLLDQAREALGPAPAQMASHPAGRP